MDKKITIFEEDRLYLAKGIFRLAQKVTEGSFDWKRLMQFRNTLITGTQIVALTTFRLSALLGALDELDVKRQSIRAIRLRKTLATCMKES